MNKIKFSHRYYKMPEDVSETMLIQVIEINRKDLSNEFVGYDTGYQKGNGDYAEYELPKGQLILLMLQSIQEGNPPIIWTTIRASWPPKKIEYYKSLVGKNVAIVIQNECNCGCHIQEGDNFKMSMNIHCEHCRPEFYR